MSHKIVFTVAAKEAVLPDCVKLVEKSYEDTIVRGKEYFGDNQMTIAFVNLCGKAFDVPSFKLFSNSENGGSFYAEVSPFTIGVNQQISIPLKYYGMWKSPADTKDYIINFNGTSSPFRLNIIEKKIQHPPVISTVEILLENRENYVFKLSDFTSKFTDIDGDSLDLIILEGDLSQFRLNGETLTSPAKISTYNINVGALVYIAKDTDDETSFAASLKAKDSSGLISN